MKTNFIVSLFIAVLAYLILAAYITIYFMGAATKPSAWFCSIFGAISWTFIAVYEFKKYRKWKDGKSEI